MNPIYMWFLAYAIPCLLAGTAIKLLPKSKDRVGTPFITIAVATLFISIFVSQYFIHTSGFVFPWYPKALSIVAYVLSVFIATRLIGKMSMWYSPFALIQELAIASFTFLLLCIHSLELFLSLNLLYIPRIKYHHVTPNFQHTKSYERIFNFWHPAGQGGNICGLIFPTALCFKPYSPFRTGPVRFSFYISGSHTGSSLFHKTRNQRRSKGYFFISYNRACFGAL